jgi:hypothetical protein
MDINLNNYEAYMIDFLDGKLDASLCEDLRHFLEIHPQLAEELEMVKAMPVFCQGDESCPCKAELSLNKAGLPGLGERTADLWLAASLEGDLDADLEAELDYFLEANPAWKNARVSMSRTKLEAGHEEFEGKSALKRTAIPIVVNQDNYLNWLVARMEGQTIDIENDAIDHFISLNSELQAEDRMLAMTRFQPDMAIRFEGKRALRRFVIPLMSQHAALRVAGLAASLLLLIGLYQNGHLFDGQDNSRINIAGFEWQGPAVPALKGQPESGTAMQSEIALPSYARNEHPAPGSIGLKGAELHVLAQVQIEPTELELRHEKKPRVVYAGGSEIQPSSLSLQQYGAVKLRQYAYGTDEPVSANSKVTGWELADAGIKGINKLTRRDLRFERQFTPEGKLKSYRLGTDRVYLAKQ